MFFNLKLPEGWIVLKVKISDIANSSPNLVETVLRIRPRDAMSDVRSRALSCETSGDRVMPRAQVCVRG